jgi:hypothetical protein
MSYSALALEQGLRLRSRRVRSDRPQTSTARLALIAAILAALVGFLGSSVRVEALPWFGGPPAADIEPSAGVALERLSGAAMEPLSGVATEPLVSAAVEPLVSAAVEPLDAVPPPRALALAQQRYADALWSIHTQVEQTIAWVGLGAAFYKSHEIDRAELRARLTQGLAGYRAAERQIEALDPPPALRPTHEGYLAAVRLFQLSTIEMLRMYEDGDEEHLTTALPLSLDGTSKLRDISGQFWPDVHPPG